ncbi:MAG: lipopolysaccharide kinase InaA family protein, partial [Ancrocorticia populi]
MNPSLQIMAAQVDPGLFDLPWDTPIAEWPEDIIAALPRGISRHTVRFVYLGERIIAVKEIGERVAYREYEMLRDLGRHDAPAVEPVAIVTGRSTADGEPLSDALVTEHLVFSLPYRAIFGQHQRQDSVRRLIDALSVLMVRLHLLGFYWGDVSLSNTLFRRDAGEFAAYLVDAETGELYPSLTTGKREYDIDVARTNIIGELMDLQAGEILQMDVDAIEVGDTFVQRYNE